MTPLNPFFRQEVSSEQRLVQDLVNEHLRMYGQEVYYLPRKYHGTDSIMRENILARFNDAYPIEAYVANVDGFQGSGDLMTKFGIRVTDEATFIISKERFEDYITELISNIDSTEDQRRADPDDGVAIRPVEGDLVYFPLTDSLFEIKFVEHESPFYQLGKLYTYELRCELFEYEQEVIDTGIGQIDDNLSDIGYVVTLTLAGTGVTATANAGLRDGAVNELVLLNDGYGYTSTPTVAISSSPNGNPNSHATAVAITTIGAGSTTYSIKSLQITNTGFGYTQAPTVTIVGSGSGAKARANIGTSGVFYVSGFTGGSEYTDIPNIGISTSPVGLSTANAAATAVVSAAGTITGFRITNAGFGYTEAPTVTIDTPYKRRRATGTVGFTTLPVGLGTVTSIRISDAGFGYTTAPTVTISDPSGFSAGIITAQLANAGVGSTLSALLVGIGTTNTGRTTGNGYGVAPVLTISDPSGFRAGVVTAGVGIGTTINSISLGYSGAFYSSSPVVSITGPSTTLGIGSTAIATSAIDTSGRLTAITLTSPGFGYSTTDTITVTLTGGIGTATGIVGIATTSGKIISASLTNIGFGYTTVPTVTLVGGISTATATASISATGSVTGVTLTNVGAGYTTQPTVSFSIPNTPVNTGDYVYNEIVTGQTGLATALVKDWDKPTRTLKVYSVAGDLRVGEILAGSATTVSTANTSHITANYFVESVSYEHNVSTGVDAYESNTEFQDAATDVDGIVDWTETNPFGTF